MPFDPFLSAKLHLLEGASWSSIDAGTLARVQEYSRDPAEWSAPAEVSIRDDEVAGLHGPVRCRVYNPARPSGIGLVWAHGGGFGGGDLEMPEAHMVAAELAARAGTVVVSVDYRLAADGVRYPVPIDDVSAVWSSVVNGEDLLGTEGLEWLALGGASAGAALALATSMRMRDGKGTPPAALLVAYPFAHFPNPAPEPALSAELAGLPQILRFSPESVEDMVRNYVGRVTDLPADALPGAAALGGLPPVHLLISEYDDLRSSAELLQRQLVEVGVPVTAHLAPGMPHGHLNRTPSLPEVDRSLDYFAAALRGGLV
ncbi:alpha/beta hydrolase fold domain-containing protein [Cellulomonas sp. KRMCY2]|uniref:alpha/beta hydrolase fold domain-containing protein n=1 Tax=Cellulomonas sp. KRMCY2 TaxID=1304865 RepID=UPI00045E8594|nr:alpha/beta hydrolase fold domain-containing protein [Cellulomonas sp. KRMCY2]